MLKILPTYYFDQKKRFYSKSYQFKLKNFRDVQVGDIISNTHDKNLYLIFKKNNKVKYLEGEKINKLNELSKNHILQKYHNKIESPKTIVKFIPETITFEPSYLKMDKINHKRFYHVDTHHLDVGDIVLDPSNHRYYKIIAFHRASDGLCGGIYDASYYDIIEVEPNTFNRISNKVDCLGVSMHNGQLQKHFVVLEEY